MAPNKERERRAAPGDAGAAIPEHAPAAGDSAPAGGANIVAGLPVVHVCRAGFAGRGTPFARPTRRHTLAFPSDPRQGLGSC